MKARKRPYLGLKGGAREVFRSSETPTQASHGTRYGAVIGPFRTMRAAVFMQRYGHLNPHLQTVAQAEKASIGFGWKVPQGARLSTNLGRQQYR